MIDETLYEVNSAPEAVYACYDLVCPELPSHGKPNMYKTSCEERRKKAEKSSPCAQWPHCDRKIQPQREGYIRKHWSALTALVGKAICDGQSNKEIQQGMGLNATQISKHRCIILANPDLYPDIDLDSAPEPEIEDKPKRGPGAQTDNAKFIADRIVTLRNQGYGVQEIADEVGRSREIVYVRLREAGMGVDRTNFKSEVHAWLDKNPSAGHKDVRAQFSCPRTTAHAYFLEWQRRRKGWK